MHYHWRSAEFPEYHFGEALNSGLIAQEVEKLFPEMVGVDVTATKPSTTANCRTCCWEPSANTKAENDSLQAKLSAETDRLKAENNALQLRLGAQSELMHAIEARLAQLEQSRLAK